MNGDIVAQRYAKALFALGQQEGMAKLEQYGENLSALEGVLEDSPELVRLFHIRRKAEGPVTGSRQA